MKWTEGQVLHRWTRHEYKRLIDHGFLDEDDPIELLDGLLLVKEPPDKAHPIPLAPQCGDGETSQLVARGDPSLSPFALINVPGVGDVLGRY
jgi:hypothetical protein